MSAGSSVIVIGRRPPPVTGENLLTRKLAETLRELGFPVDQRRRLDLRNLFLFRRTIWFTVGAKPISFPRDVLLIALWLACGNRVFCYLHNASRQRFLRWQRALGLLKNPRVVFVLIAIDHQREFLAHGYAGRTLSNCASDVTPDAAGPRRAKRLLWCSMVSMEKGFPKACAAFQILRQRDPEWVFDVCGYGPLAQPNRTEPGITFHGFIDGAAKAKAFRAGGILVLPSAYVNETQPVAVLEALGFGLPVVASEVGGIPQMLETTGEACGFTLAPTASAAEYVEKIEAIMADYEAFSAAAQRCYAAKFSPAAYRATVREIMEDSPPEG